MTASDRLDRIARAICAERCASYGDPPCHKIGEWPNPHCEIYRDEAGCKSLAIVALKAMEE